MYAKVQASYHFKIVALCIDMKKINLGQSMAYKYCIQWLYVHVHRFDEGFESSVEMLEDMLPIERAQLIIPEGQIRNRIIRALRNVVKGCSSLGRSDRHWIYGEPLAVLVYGTELGNAVGNGFDQQACPLGIIQEHSAARITSNTVVCPNFDEDRPFKPSRQTF
jgi:hypothetical protein